jgi:hypothetical protein
MRNFILCFATVLTISGCTQEKSNLLTKSDSEGRVFLGPSNAVFYFKGGKVETYRPPYMVDSADSLESAGSWVKEFDGGWRKGITDTLVLFNSDVKYTFDTNYTAHIPNFVDGHYGDTYRKIDRFFEINDTAVIDSNNLFKTLTGQPWMVFHTTPPAVISGFSVPTSLIWKGNPLYYEEFRDVPSYYMGFTTDGVCKIFLPDETFIIDFASGKNTFRLVWPYNIKFQMFEIANTHLIVEQEGGEYLLFKPLDLDLVLPLITGEKLYY